MHSGETLDLTAQASIKGGDDLIMKLVKDGVNAAYTHQEGSAGSPTIDDHSASLLYRGIVESGTATFKLCLRGDAPLNPGRMQWGYRRYYTQANWDRHDNTE